MKRIIASVLCCLLVACSGAPLTTAPDLQVDPPNMNNGDSGDGGTPTPMPTTPAPQPTTVPTTMPTAPPSQVVDSGMPGMTVPDAGNPSMTVAPEAGPTEASTTVNPPMPEAGSPSPTPDAGMVMATCSGSATQACGNCQSGTQTRTCTNGVWSDWGACSGATVASLAGVGAGDFTISFDLTDMATNYQAILNQRFDCATPSTHALWDVTYNSTACSTLGSLQVQTYSPTQGLVTHCTFGGTSGHHIELHRVSGTMYFIEDGSSVANWPDTTSLAGLGTLAVGTDVCQAVQPLAGTVTNVCVEKQ